MVVVICGPVHSLPDGDKVRRYYVHNEGIVRCVEQCVLSNKRNTIAREMVIRMVLCYFVK
jgi:hypothetical protein